MDKAIVRLRTVALSFVTLTLMISQFNLLGSVYAKENEKIGNQKLYGELYNQDINADKMTSTVDVQTGDPDIITKEPVIEARDTSHENDVELEEKRTENTKTYELRTGEYITEYYFEPIHKKDKDTYKEIENDLEKKESLFKSYPTYENKDGLYDVSIENGTVTIKDPHKEEISILPEGQLTNYAVKENVILYSEVNKNLDLEYRINSQFIQQNIYINGDLEEYSYSFEIKKNDYTLIEDENGSLLFMKDNQKIYTLMAPYLIDKDGNRNQDVSYSYNQDENGNIKVIVSFDAIWLQDETRVFPVTAKANIAVRAVEVLDLNSSYIRSGRPNIQSQYSDLFVGYDDNYYGGANSNIKIARTFIHFAMPNIGKNQRIENAYLKLYKEQDLATANELNDIDIYNSNYVNPSTVTWNTQPTGSAKQFISNNKFSKPKGWKNFDITKHVQDLNKGQKKTLILQTTDESNKYRCNVFNSESTSRLPKVEIHHSDDYDINPNLDVNQFDNELRVYAKDGQYFEGISMDGIAKPDSTIKLDLYAKINDTDFNKVSTHSAKGQTSRYFIDPIYITNPIAGTQIYKKDDVNYTTDYFKMGQIPKYDTFYEYRMKVSYNGKDSTKELVTDGFIVYKVKLGDNLKTIASHYGLKVEDIKRDNNTKTNKIIEGDILFLRFSKNNPKVPKDVYKPPVKISSYEAKYVYRGPSCYGSCSVADPINTSIGNFYHESADFTLIDFDELSMERVYNSYGEDNASMFGTNFSSNFEQYISYDKDDNMLFFRGDGKIVKINKTNGQYKPRPVDKIDISIKEGKVSIYDQRSEYTYIFDEYGILTSIKTKTGFQTQFIYDEIGYITEIKLGDKKATFEYNSYNLVSKINLPNKTSVQYKYNNDRQLIEFTDTLGNKEKYVYDDNGKIKSIVDKNGNTLAQNTYTQKGVVTSQIDANGNKVDFAYNSNSTSVTYNNQETEVYNLDSDYKTTKITNGDGNARSYKYDDKGRMTQEVDEEGQVTTYNYNAEGLLLKQTNPNGLTEEYTYDSKGNVLTYKDEQGLVETYGYDANNNLIYKDTQDQFKTLYEYNSKNLVTKETDAFGVWKSYEYTGNLISKITHSNGLIESYNYDSMGNVLKESDNKGRSTSYVYDNANRVIKKTDAYGKSESYKYDGNGNIVEYIDQLGSKVINTYDKNGNLIASLQGTLRTTKTYDYHNRISTETNEQGLTTSYEYDVNGQVIKEIDAYGNIATTDYDSLGRVIKTIDIKGNVSENQYTGNLLTKTINPHGQTTEYEYDDKGRVIKTILPQGQEEIKEYNNRGQVVKTINERGLTKMSEYDQYDRIVKEVDEHGVATMNTYNAYGQLTQKNIDGVITTYKYDVYGNQIEETDAYGHTTTSKYDYLDRLIEETDELGYKTTYKYDAAGNEIEVTDALGNKIKKTYNIHGILIQETDKLGNTLTYTYDDLGYPKETTDAYNNVTQQVYDEYGNLKEVYLNETLVESHEYDEYGRETKKDTITEIILTEYDSFDQVIQVTNEITGLITTNKYDDFGNKIKTSDNGGKEIVYTYDGYNQEIMTVDEYGRKSAKLYDKYGQVTQEMSYTNERIIKVYDKKGNEIRTINHFGVVTDIEYDLLNRKISETIDSKKTLTYTYDAKGQMISLHDSITDGTETYTYDALGRTVKITNPLGYTIQKEYDAHDQEIKVINPKGGETSKEYDIYGNIIKETDELGYVKQIKYNEFNLVEQEVDERGFAETYRYNDQFQLVELVDKFGKSIIYEYNDQGYVSKEINQNNYETIYEYDLYGQVIKEVDPKNNEKTYQYDLLGNIVEISEPHRLTINTYNDFGLLESTKENKIITLKNSYNEYNQVVETQDALSNKTAYTYDKYGNIIREVFVDQVTENVYDMNGLLIEKVENSDKITTYNYDVLGQVIKETENNLIVLENTYNELGLLAKEVKQGVPIQYVYNAKGQQIEQQLPSLNKKDEFVTIITVTYDESGNPVRFEDCEGNVLEQKYDAYNHMISETDTNNNTTKYEYDGIGNLVKAQSPLERVVTYEYDGNNNVTVKHINDKKALYEYDENNNLIQEISEYGLKESYQYDDLGNMVQLTKNDGQKLTYTYDDLGRKTSEGSKKYEYDAYGNITKASYDKTLVEYTYDLHNNIIQVTDAHDKDIQYKWDAHGNKMEIQYDAYKIKYTYNQYGKIDQVLKNDKVYADYQYDQRGNVISLKRDGITTTYDYDQLNRRTKYNHKKGKDIISTYEYTYDGQNNIISEIINGVKNTYTYNELDELKTSNKTINGTNVYTEYTYDIFGNKIETNHKGDSKVYTYNDKNQLESIKESQIGKTSLYYDDNGNIRDIYYSNGEKEHYEYDEFDQIIGIETKGDFSYEYQYDADGDRIEEIKFVKDKQKTVNTETYYKEWLGTLYPKQAKNDENDIDIVLDNLKEQVNFKEAYNGLCASRMSTEHINKESHIVDVKQENPVTTYILDKTVDNAVILSMGQDIHIYGEERLSVQGTKEDVTYISGLNESVMATVSNEDIKHIAYEDTGKSTDNRQEFRYNGERQDETGNIYLRARYYNPRIGQFIQIDSYRGEKEDVTSQGRYTYALNNQYKYVDRDGNFAIAIAVGAFAYVTYKIKNNSEVKKEKERRKQQQDYLTKIGEKFLKTGQATGGLKYKFNKTGKQQNTPPTTNPKELKKFFNTSNKKPTLKEYQACPYKYMSLTSQYNTIFSTLYYSVGSGEAKARSRISISKYSGEAKNLLGRAITDLSNARTYGMNEKKKSLESLVINISNYSKSAQYLGSEYKREVTKHAKNMYNRIVSNISPYKATQYWTSDYGYIKVHLPETSEAYKFYTSAVYKNSIKVGELTNIYMPIIADGLTGYIVYKRFLTDKPNVYNNYQSSGVIKYPGSDPNNSPGPGFEWRGAGDPSSGKGNWYNPTTGEMFHPDLSHPAPIGPHWDYTDANGIEYRIMPDGSKIPKYGGN